MFSLSCIKCEQIQSNLDHSDSLGLDEIEREISLSNKATLSQSDLIRMFFVSYKAFEAGFCVLKAKQSRLFFAFQRCSFKRNMATDLDHD